jgi:hypothetical protein
MILAKEKPEVLVGNRVFLWLRGQDLVPPSCFRRTPVGHPPYICLEKRRSEGRYFPFTPYYNLISS